jgi:Protein of unknown function (DUF4058)
MPSPFPGMNPYLEQPDAWQDFHSRYVPALGDALAALVRPNFIVKIGEYMFIHEPPAEQRYLIGHADVSLSHPDNRPGRNGGTATLPSPVVTRIPNVDFEEHLYLEVRDRENRELVTTLEVLSPTNKKPGPDREQYLAKRANLLHSEAHFVEIDLLRSGSRMPVEDATICDYAIMVSRVEDRPNVNYWPLHLREPLPPIPIPLRAPQPFVTLDLQGVLHVVYDRAFYGDYIYRGKPSPPLRQDDASWAESLILPQS